jgi:hypothetical protein
LAAAAKPIAGAAAKPVAAPVGRAAAPNIVGAVPKSTVLGAGVAPVAAAAAAHAAKPAAAPIAASAAAAVAQASAARPAAPAKPVDDAKPNLAYAQTQHHGAFMAASQAAQAAGPASAPRTSPQIAAAVPAADAFDPHAETDPPDPLESPSDALDEAPDEESPPSPGPKYLPGDPMAPHTQPVAARAPMLRYDDSIPKLSRVSGQDKKWLWIAAGVIVVACLGLVFVLASRMSH